MCLAAGVPLVESGTAGYLGQVQPILKVCFSPAMRLRSCTGAFPWTVCWVLSWPHCSIFAVFLPPSSKRRPGFPWPMIALSSESLRQFWHFIFRYAFHRIEQSVLIACPNQYRRAIPFARSEARLVNLFTVSYGQRVIYSRECLQWSNSDSYSIFTTSSVSCLANPKTTELNLMKLRNRGRTVSQHRDSSHLSIFFDQVGWFLHETLVYPVTNLSLIWHAVLLVRYDCFSLTISGN